LGRLPDASLRTVIAHELAHLGRRDHWIAFIQLVAECVWWWNPLFWYVRRQMRQNAELACDAWVVSIMPQARRAYAEALIAVSADMCGATLLTTALGINSGGRQALETRLTMIMRDRVPCKLPALGLFVMAVLGSAALPGWAQVLNAELPPEPSQVRPAAAKAEVSDDQDQLGRLLEQKVRSEVERIIKRSVRFEINRALDRELSSRIGPVQARGKPARRL
jgi:beta-lactamase regulating signal transducer with metallopeptidase domain